eukprot:1969197-Amphidinium_carterae.1
MGWLVPAESVLEVVEASQSCQECTASCGQREPLLTLCCELHLFFVPEASTLSVVCKGKDCHSVVVMANGHIKTTLPDQLWPDFVLVQNTTCGLAG